MRPVLITHIGLLLGIWPRNVRFACMSKFDLGAMLLAAIVTILLARLANSQFVIQVTIRDFWGAVAIGFIANYIGRKMLDRMVPEGKGE